MYPHEAGATKEMCCQPVHYFENPKMYFLCKLMGSISRRQPPVFIMGSDLVRATQLHQTKGSL